MSDDIQNHPEALPDESGLLDVIEGIVRLTKKAYGYQHLSTIGTHLRQRFPEFDPAVYGHKKLLDIIEAHPERFKVKWSTPAHKGRSHVWVRLSTEPKRKEGYRNAEPPKPKPKPRLMTAKEFDRLCDWLDGPKGCNFHYDENGEIRWTCDGSLRKTRKWLKRRDFLSLEANIKAIQALGGYCDCEVLFNAVGNWVEG